MDGRKIPSIIDTDATSSVMASRYTHGRDLDKKDVKPIRVGDGSVQWSLGSTYVDVLVGQEKMRQKVLVMDTSAFDLILGMDFLSHESVEGILFRPYARLVVNGKEYPLDEMKEEINWMRKMWVTESYQLDPIIRRQALEDLGQPQELAVDLFADAENALEEKFITKKQNSWTFHWGLLSKEKACWANPPFSKLVEVMHKVALDEAKIVICTPDWGRSGGAKEWRELLDRMTVIRVPLPDKEIYWRGKDHVKVPKPRWGSMVSLTDGSRIVKEDLAEKLVKILTKLNKGRSFPDLMTEKGGRRASKRKKRIPGPQMRGMKRNRSPSRR